MVLCGGLCGQNKSSILVLLILTFVFFLENFDRYLIGVALIPYINYTSYEYSLLSGSLFSIFYAIGGVVIALILVQQDSCEFGKKYDSKVNVQNTVKYLTIATCIFSITFACTAVATNFAQQAIIRMIMGLTQSVVTPLSVGIIDKLFSESDHSTNVDSNTIRASAFGIFNYGVYLAFSLSLSIGM